MSFIKQFGHTTGYFRVKETYGGWSVLGADGLELAYVKLHEAHSLAQTESDARLFAGSPEMLDTLVRAHNNLNKITENDQARKIQHSIRGGLVKVFGDQALLRNMRDYRIIMPDGREIDV